MAESRKQYPVGSGKKDKKDLKQDYYQVAASRKTMAKR